MARTPTPLVLTGLVAAGIALFQALLITWFAWPAKSAEPRDLPIVVAGPGPAVTVLQQQLEAARPGAFDVTVVSTESAADDALRDREAYAAFIVGATGVEVHIASAGSPAVATLISQAAQGMAKGQNVEVIDVVASPSSDPRGAGLTAGFMPLIMTSIACGIALLFLVKSHRVRVIGLLAFSVLAGLIAAGLLHGQGVLSGSYLAAAGVIGLVTLSVSAAVSGLGAVLGNPGLGLGALTVFFFGNPISAAASAPELLPQPWGLVGQFLPPGAGSSLLRSVAFFDGAAATRPLLVLLAWAITGLILTAIGHFRDNGKAPSLASAASAAPGITPSPTAKGSAPAAA
ncbi:MAG: hypothetical protein JXA67_16975 [Micromonosporaceae bacterium]|nr:hypothetical protein [Micromonosporaceae bacterium]